METPRLPLLGANLSQEVVDMDGAALQHGAAAASIPAAGEADPALETPALWCPSS